MPDTRRIAGPENTQSPFSFRVAEATEAVTDGKRTDGRQEHDHRPVFLKAGLLSQAKGSAFAEFGQTKVVCAVYGPREVQRREDFSIQGQINCEVKFGSLFMPRASPAYTGWAGERFLSTTFGGSGTFCATGQLPKSQVDIYVSVLENDGSILSAAITCACLALADAGIELYDLVVSCTARIQGQSILMDPSASEDSPKKAIEVCQDSCQKLYEVLQETLVNMVKSRKKAV